MEGKAIFLTNTPLLVSLFLIASFSIRWIQANDEKDCYPFSNCNFDTSPNPENLSEERHEEFYPESKSSGNEFINIFVVVVVLFVIFLVVRTVLYFFEQREAAKARRNLETYIANVEDNWTRSHSVANGVSLSVPTVPSQLDDPAPAYLTIITNNIESTPSAPVTFVDVNGNINDDPPSYNEVVVRSP